MMPPPADSVSMERRRAMLRTAMGPAIAAALSDPRVIEIMVNPDGALRVDILGEGRVDTDVKLDAPTSDPRSMATSPSCRLNCRHLVLAPGSGSRESCRPFRPPRAFRSENLRPASTR